MKRLFLTAIAVLGFAFTSFAQDGTTKIVKKTESKTKVVRKDNGVVVKKTDTKVVLKKDGTPDRRYKKQTKVVLKKDGTPDKRYK